MLVQCSRRACRPRTSSHQAATACVADEAAGDVDPAVGQPVEPGFAADADEGDVGGDAVAVGEHQAAGVVEALDPDTGAQPGAGLDEQPGAEAAELFAEGAGEGDGEGFEDGDVDAAVAGVGGDLGSDEPGADDDERRGGVEGGAQGEGVVEGAQGVDAVGLVGEAAGDDPGGDDDRVGVEGGAVVELDAAGLPAGGAGAEIGADSEVVVGVGGAEGDAVGVPGAGEELLGQRGPVVGEVFLGADEADAAVVSVAAQGLDSAEPTEARADDEDVPDLLRLHRRDLRSAPDLPGPGSILADGRCVAA